MALKEGCVLLFDRKAMQEVYQDSISAFVQDDLLEIAFGKILFNTFINFSHEDAPEKRPFSVTTQVSDSEVQYEAWLRDEAFAFLHSGIVIHTLTSRSIA